MDGSVSLFKLSAHCKNPLHNFFSFLLDQRLQKAQLIRFCLEAVCLLEQIFVDVRQVVALVRQRDVCVVFVRDTGKSVVRSTRLLIC